MEGLLRFLDATPRRLRWALFLPVGIGCSLIVESLVDTAFAVAGPAYRTTPGVIETATGAFIAGVTRTLFPAVVSPKPWPVGIVMFTVGFLLRALPFAYLIITAPYLRSRAPGAVVVIAASAVGGCLGLYLIRRAQRAA